MPKPKKLNNPVTQTETGVMTQETLGNTPIEIILFPGSIEGDRLRYTARGKDRALFLFGSAEQIANYSIGLEQTLNGEKTPAEFAGTYQRQVSRKDEVPTTRIADEMHGTGDIEKIAQKKEGRPEGYTVTVNGQKVAPTANIARYFQKLALINVDGKPTKKLVAELTEADTRIMLPGQNGQEPAEVWGKVEMVISATIKPGQPYNSKPEGLVSKVYQ